MDVIPRRTQVTDLLLGESRVMLRLVYLELLVAKLLYQCFVSVGRLGTGSNKIIFHYSVNKQLSGTTSNVGVSN